MRLVPLPGPYIHTGLSGAGVERTFPGTFWGKKGFINHDWRDRHPAKGEKKIKRARASRSTGRGAGLFWRAGERKARREGAEGRGIQSKGGGTCDEVMEFSDGILEGELELGEADGQIAFYCR